MVLKTQQTYSLRRKSLILLKLTTVLLFSSFTSTFPVVTTTSTAATPQRVATAGEAAALQLAMNCSLAREVATSRASIKSTPSRIPPTLSPSLFRRSLRTLAHPRLWYREYRATTYVLLTSIDSSSQIKEPPPTYPSIACPQTRDVCPLAESTSIIGAAPPLAGEARIPRCHHNEITSVDLFSSV